MGVALNMDEYVPEITPTSKAKTNHFIDTPPKMNRAVSVITTVVDVAMDRRMVSTIE